MIIQTHIIKQKYRDSVQLMQAASSASRREGVEIASVIMGTPKNKPLLEEVGLLTTSAQLAGPNDIIVVIRGDSETNVTNAINFVIELLSKEVVTSSDDSVEYKSLEGARNGFPDANLVVISVPGIYAAREANRALDRNCNVLLFSDNVSIADEKQIKTKAHEKGLIVMGPDAGTAMIKSIGLGFANNVIPGPIGIVAASGTGTQEVCVLCHQQGVGVTHAIGTGSRDVKDAIGGITMLDGINSLEKDPLIQLLVIISKPPEDKTMSKILERIKSCSKPVVVNFLGKKAGYFDHSNKYITVSTLEEAALTAANYFSSNKLKVNQSSSEKTELALKSLKNLDSKRKYIRGLFAGGTFTFEAAMIITDILGSNTVWTNVHLNGTQIIPNPHQSQGHTLIDMGDDEFTSGKPHPMIDQFERTERFLKEIQDPEVGMILLDFVFGHGSHEDPISDMKDAFEKWIEINRPMPIICHVCGTDLDPQDYKASIEKLEAWGAIVLPTNAQMAKLAALYVKQNEDG